MRIGEPGPFWRRPWAAMGVTAALGVTTQLQGGPKPDCFYVDISIMKAFHAKLFSSSYGVRLVYFTWLHLGILCAISV